MELNLKNLAPLLQCTSINRCTLFITSKRKKYYFINFLSPLLLKKYFFLFLFLSLSGFSSFFLFQSSILIRPASLLNPLLRSSTPTTPHCPVPIEAQPSTNRSPAQRRPLFAFSTSKAEPLSSTLSLLSHAQRRCGFVFVFFDLLWASRLVYVFVTMGLCSLWVFFFFAVDCR